MAKVYAPLLAFNRGEVSKIALARVDVEKLRLAAECQVNWEPRVVGPMSLRAGLGHVGSTRGDAAAKFVPFVFSNLDTALLEFTANELRVWIDDALVTRPAVSTTISDPNFAGGGSWSTADTTSGASVTISSGACTLTCTPVGGLARVKQQITVASGDHGVEHGIRFAVSNGPVTVRAGSAAGLSDYIAQTVLDTGTHALACTPSSDIYLQIESTDPWNKTLSGVTIDAAGTLEIPTSFGAGDIASIRPCQSGDIVFVATYGIAQYKVERRSTHGWSVVLYRSSNGPFQTAPGIEANFTPGAYYGNTTLTSDQAYFQAGHVGCLFRLFSSGQAYQTVLGAANAFSPPVRVTGVGTVARNYSWTASGTWVGTLTLQRSFDGPDSGFTDVSTTTSNGAVSSATGSSAATPDLDNAIAWERIGFKGGAYTSGSATVISGYAGGGGFALVRVTGYVSPTQVNIEVLEPFSSLTATTDWLEQDWSGVVGYPTAVRIQEGRLTWTGRDKMWLSQPDDYTGYAVQDLQGNDLGDAAAIIETFGEGPVDSVNWVLPLTRPLFGREMSIAAARSSSFDEPITPTNFSVKDCATIGAARLDALKVDKRGRFVAQSGRVYGLEFDPQALDYKAYDLTRLNLDIFKPGFVDLAVARQPDTAEYFIRGDGMAAVLLDDPDDEVVAWWRLMTLGVIENVVALPPGSGTEDRVYFVVRRTVNGVTRRFLEKLAPRSSCVGGALNLQLDSYVTATGTNLTTVTAAHLPSTPVALWADGVALGTVTTDGAGVATLPDGATASNIVAGLAGALTIGFQGQRLPSGNAPDQVFTQASATLTVGTAYNGYPAEVWADMGGTGRLRHVGALTVAGGVVTLPNSQTATVIVACLGYVAPFMSAKLAYAGPNGSPVNARKRLGSLGLILFDTARAGLQFGQRFDALDPLPAIEGGDAVPGATVWSEYDEPMHGLPGDWDTDARLCLLAQAPNPCTVGGAVPAIEIG